MIVMRRPTVYPVLQRGSRAGGHRGEYRRESGCAVCLRVGCAALCDDLPWQELPATRCGQAAWARRWARQGAARRSGSSAPLGRDRWSDQQVPAPAGGVVRGGQLRRRPARCGRTLEL